jgi:uncharacterized protein DUF6894
MSRFYFHFRDGSRLIHDVEGAEFPSADQAREEALSSAREVLANAVRSGKDVGADALVVIDERGDEITLVPFSEALPKRLRRPSIASRGRQ